MAIVSGDFAKHRWQVKRWRWKKLGLGLWPGFLPLLP